MTDKERYQSLKDRGICVYCKTAPSEDGKTSCRRCREKQRLQTEEKRAALKRLGFCTECGSNRIYGKEKICPVCAAKKYEYNRKSADNTKQIKYQHDRKIILKSQGICIKCGKRQAEIGKTRCKQCNISEQIRARTYRGNEIPRHERPSYGMCYFCGQSITSGKICKKCKERNTNNLPKISANPYWRNQDQARVAEIMAKRKEKAVGSDINISTDVPHIQNH